MTLIILEGPRAAGKTTIARLLKERRQEINEFKVERGIDPEMDMMRFLDDIEHVPDIWVADRFHLTEYVYSLWTKRREREEVEASTWRIHEMIIKAGHTQAILMANADELTRRIKERYDGRGFDMPSEVAVALWEHTSEKFEVPLVYLGQDYEPDEYAYLLAMDL